MTVFHAPDCAEHRGGECDCEESSDPHEIAVDEKPVVQSRGVDDYCAVCGKAWCRADGKTPCVANPDPSDVDYGKLTKTRNETPYRITPVAGSVTLVGPKAAAYMRFALASKVHQKAKAQLDEALRVLTEELTK